MKGFITRFISHLGIHGFSYLVQQKLSKFERFFWFFLIILSIIGMIFLSEIQLARFKKKSTIVGLENDYYFWNVTMPALTICPVYPTFNLTVIDDYMKENKIPMNLKDDFIKFFQSLATSTYNNFLQLPSYPKIQALNISSNDYMELIYNFTINYGISNITKLTNRPLRAQSDKMAIKFEQVLTEYGLCYSTNSQLLEHIAAAKLIFNRKSPDYYESLDDSSIIDIIEFRRGNYFDGEISYHFLGFQNNTINIFIHSAYEAINVAKSALTTSYMIKYHAGVRELTTSDNVQKETTVDQRHCRFLSESNLTYFSIYSRQLCFQECRMQLAIELCNCVPYFYPKTHGKTVCSYDQLKTCLGPRKTYLLKFIDDRTKTTRMCDCLPRCNGQILFIENAIPEDKQALTGGIGGDIQMTQYPKFRFKRDVLFTMTDLFISIGGLAGLFLGLSVLSIAEILYFLLIRH